MTDLSPLANLTALTALNLYACSPLTELSPLAELTALTSLNLSGCELLTDLRPLENLTALITLELSGCELLTELSPLANLTALTTLNLYGCRQLTDLSPLENCRSLKKIFFDYAGQKSLQSIYPLLDRLEHLSLHQTQFDNLDDALTGTDYFDNVVDKLRSHFADLERGNSRES